MHLLTKLFERNHGFLPYHYSDAFLTIEAPFYFLLGLLAVYRTSIQSMQNGRTPFAWFGAVALLIPVYYRMMMKPVKTV